MDCFIKKLLTGKPDEQMHKQFVRFGKGDYSGRAALNLMKSSKVKLKGSFEYANDFALFVSELGNFRFSGIILSKEKLELENEKLKSGLYGYETSISSEKVKEIFDQVYFMLLDGENQEISLKIKKKLPKPGKSGNAKIDDTFCILEADLKYWNKIKDAFFWDIGDCKKAKVNHEYKITSLEMPKGEKDFAQIRLKTKRKGRIIRKLEVDSIPKVIERDFEA